MGQPRSWFCSIIALMQGMLGRASGVVLAGLFAAMPTSTNYSLKGYDLGGSGNSGSSSSYKLNATAGSQGTNASSSASYGENAGQPAVNTSNVPPAPTFTNPSSYYDRLQLVLATGGNPTDAKYAIAISPDGFTTTQYVKSDHSVGGSLAGTDYPTYAAWGGASGFLVLGLLPGTTYTVKVKAMQGNFSESAYGPTATAATLNPTVSFTVATTLSATPPFTISFGSLAPGSVTSSTADASLTLSTNALTGGRIYVRDSNAGLQSLNASYTLSSATADLTSTKGYGAAVLSASQVSGGPLAAVAPFDATGNNVGVLTTTLREIASTSAPVTSGSLTVRLKAKTDIGVPSATDYADVLTFVAAMLY